MESYAPFLAGLVALLVGLAAGKAWERYKLQEGRWIDRRRARESPHYILGLNSMVAGQLDRAIGELAEAARLQPDALEIEMILGNLYREKGQVGRAITIHQQLLQRPKLTRLEHAYILLCLALDYKRGGFVDRAHEAFSEVLRFEPQNPYALMNLQKLHEEQHQWQQAREVRQRLVAISPEAEQPRNRQILAFIENELGRDCVKRGEPSAAVVHFEAALDLDPRNVPGVPQPGRRAAGPGQGSRGGAGVGARHRGRARTRVSRLRSARVASTSRRSRPTGSTRSAAG